MLQMTLSEWAKFNKMTHDEVEKSIISAACAIGNAKMDQHGTNVHQYQLTLEDEDIVLTIQKNVEL